MSSEIEIFRTAYREWKAATDLYNTEIENLRGGDDLAMERLAPIMADLLEKHARFMGAAKPFVYLRQSG